MAKAKTIYQCTQCGGTSPKWQGQCPDCGEWNTLEESVAEAQPKESKNRYGGFAKTGDLVVLSNVPPEERERTTSGFGEFDRVLGGGIVKGSVILLGGDPGIGKSTILLQTMAKVSEEKSVLYVSGEESAHQVSLRAKRLGLKTDKIHMYPETSLERILAKLEEKTPDIVVIDSIQTTFSEVLQSAPGSVSQVRECAAHLARFAKSDAGTTIFLVGHVTKEGSIAGPRVLEHIVDTVLYFEGDAQSNFRVLRAFKNRFGAANEVGVFSMTEDGLEEVSNPSAIFLSGTPDDAPGSCITVTQEGMRPILVEIQALVDESHTPNPRRLAVGVDGNRLSMLLAVLHRHAGVACYDNNVFVNVVGGLRVEESSSDLPVLLTVVSSIKSRPLPKKTIFFGEIGLSGELRGVKNGEERLKEAEKLGFLKAVVPKQNADKWKGKNLKCYGVKTLKEALSLLREWEDG